MTPATAARTAGLFWLLFTVAIGFGLAWLRLPIELVDQGVDQAGVSAMLRRGVVATVLAHILLLAFVLSLFHLFREIDSLTRVVMLTSCAVGAALGVANSIHHLDVLAMMAADPGFATDPAELGQALAVASKTANFGQALLELFWSATFFCFGLLVLRSGYLPRIFGWLLVAMSMGYPLNSLTKLLLPQFYPAEITQATIYLAAACGLPTMAWLIVKGARHPTSSIHPTPAAS